LYSPPSVLVLVPLRTNARPTPDQRLTNACLIYKGIYLFFINLSPQCTTKKSGCQELFFIHQEHSLKIPRALFLPEGVFVSETAVVEGEGVVDSGAGWGGFRS